MFMAIGDPVAGPLVGLFYDAPSTPEELAGPPDLAPAHSHPSDNFRVVMVGELWVGRERYHHGEFRLQRSGRPYGQDGDAPHAEGNWRVISFADRRGNRLRPTNPDLRAQKASPEHYAELYAKYAPYVPEMLDDTDDGVQGLVTTLTQPFSKVGHADGSFADADSWDPIGDGGRIAITIMGVHALGPAYVVQRTPAGQPATPAMTLGSDLFRCVIAGTGQLGDRRMEMGDTLTREAGVPWEAMVAGPDGLDELLVVGTRQAFDPQVGDDPTGWADHVTATIGRLEAELPSTAPV
jgi:hypothetical protein